MGLLSKEIIKAMAETGTKQIDFTELTGGVVKQSAIAAILRGAIPKKPHVIDMIATALKRDTVEFRRLAARDIIDKELRIFNLKIQEIYESKGERIEHKLPLYNFDTLQDSLTKQGYPKGKPASYITVPVSYGKYAYAIAIGDTSLFPRAFPGEVVIISQEYKLESIEDYGILGYDKKIYIGRIREHAPYIIIETFTPYETKMIKKKDILFAHRVVGIYRPVPAGK